MKSFFSGLICLIFISIFPISVSIASPQYTPIALSVSSEDTFLDGVPDGFNIKQFSSRLNKELIKRLDDKGTSIDTVNYKYKLQIDVDSVAHKLRPFHFKSQYIVNYKYKLINVDQKELLKLKNDQVNEDQIDLIDDIIEDILKNVFQAVKLNQ